MTPEKLFKYLPSEYLDNVLLRGKLLFRNLSYFRQSECKQRGDLLEGHHRDNPDGDITLKNLTTGNNTIGDFSFLNTTDYDHIYAFCLSKIYDRELCVEFNCDACIEIINPAEFIHRVQINLKKLLSVHQYGLLHHEAIYYAENMPAQFNIHDPKQLSFSKSKYFQHQDEYRLVFGNKNAFNLVQKIVINKLYNFREEAMKGTAKDKTIIVGNITDIARRIT